MLNLSKDAKIVRVMNAVAAGVTAQDTAVVDMQGFDSVCFVAELGDVTVASVLTLTAKQNSVDSTAAATTLAAAATFTAGASDADDKIIVLDINKPRDRYVFASLTRTVANAVIEGVTAILYNADERPGTDDASVLVSNFVNDPAPV
jgi:hypothetical protein